MAKNKKAKYSFDSLSKLQKGIAASRFNRNNIRKNNKNFTNISKKK